MKNKITAIILISILVGIMVFTVGCNDIDTETEVFEAPIIENMPDNLEDYMGELEWIDGTGEATSFDSTKATVILIGGVSQYDYKYEFGLDSDIYVYDSTTSSGGLSSNASQYLISENGTTELSFYWSRMGYNVGIFHYESFADDTEAAINNKIYNSTDMTYIDKDGNKITEADKLPDFNLTELLVARWLEVVEANPYSSAVSSSKSMEVRFVGTSVGSNLAVSATEYLNKMYDSGTLDGQYVPTRVTLTNPYFSNDSFVVNGADSTVTTALSVMDSSIEYLATLGTIFEVIESDEEFFFSYEDDYSGIVETTVEDDDGETTTTYSLGTTGDSAIYNNIKENVAYLNFSESYSDEYTEEYALLDRAVLDWYLYSIVGSDDSNITITTNLGYFNSRPMLDDRNGGGSQTVSRYSISAWTPTVYARAQRGAEYVMSSRTYSSGVYTYYDYSLTKLATENYQVSDLEGIQVAGYVYTMHSKSDAINYSRDSILSGLNVKITVELTSSTVVLETVTDAGGFYSITIPSAYYSESMTIEFVSPSKNYTFATSLSTSLQDYMYMSMNGYTPSDNGVVVSLSSANYLISMVSCGFTIVD
ncbi:MAG: hypothetical protein R3Y23_06885 [Bacillota bacterium]